LYTIDNWVTHQTTGVFTDLLPKSYFVMVKDSLNCDAVYPGNPIIIINKPGVEITGHNEQPEIDNNANVIGGPRVYGGMTMPPELILAEIRRCAK